MSLLWTHGVRTVGLSRETGATHECPEPVAADPGRRPLASEEDVIAMTSVPAPADNVHGGAA